MCFRAAVSRHPAHSFEMFYPFVGRYTASIVVPFTTDSMSSVQKHDPESSRGNYRCSRDINLSYTRASTEYSIEVASNLICSTVFMCVWQAQFQSRKTH